MARPESARQFVAAVLARLDPHAQLVGWKDRGKKYELCIEVPQVRGKPFHVAKALIDYPRSDGRAESSLRTLLRAQLGLLEAACSGTGVLKARSVDLICGEIHKVDRDGGTIVLAGAAPLPVINVAILAELTEGMRVAASYEPIDKKWLIRRET